MVGYRTFGTHAEAAEHLAAMQGWPEAHIEEYVGDNEVEYVILVGGEGDPSGLRTDGYIR